MKKNYFGLPLIIAAILLSTVTTTTKLSAQVTIGSEIPPTKAALLELKTQQINTPLSSVDDANNITSTSGGLLLPRVRLVSTSTMEPFIEAADPDWTANTNNLKERLAGLMVYNLTTDPGILYPGVWTWDGTLWVTSQINTSTIVSITKQPKAFTFYELGTETPDPLEFTVSGGLSAFNYQWYRITGNNVHVRVAEPLSDNVNAWGTGTSSGTYTPGKSVLKGTTRNSNNTGFYRFYCVAKNAAGDSLISEVAEVAVGCGAKNKEGKWFSFMCFNLGALNTSTIENQKDYNIGTFTNLSNGVHTYIPGEEDVYGDLFQWGRIADGHEDRNTNTNPGVAIGTLAASDIGSGSRCQAPNNNDTPRPYYQIKKTSAAWYGKFIKGVGSATNENWNPVSSVADALWRTSRFVQNDPCAHYKSTDGGSYYQEFWHEGTDNVSDSEACTDAGTGWRMPTQAEWSELYRGGMIFGATADAEANTWVWDGTSSKPHGLELRPDAVTTTLFLPAGGHRAGVNALLYYQGATGNYWSSSVIGIYAYYMSFGSVSVNPANSNSRSYGYALRCIKN